MKFASRQPGNAWSCASTEQYLPHWELQPFRGHKLFFVGGTEKSTNNKDAQF
jgi:hypothetical protein